MFLPSDMCPHKGNTMKCVLKLAASFTMPQRQRSTRQLPEQDRRHGNSSVARKVGCLTPAYTTDCSRGAYAGQILFGGHTVRNRQPGPHARWSGEPERSV